MNKLSKWIDKRSRQKVDPKKKSELLSMMAVPLDHPVLQECVTLLRGLQEQYGDLQSDDKLTDRQAAVLDGCYAAAADAQEVLLNYAELAADMAGKEKAKAQRKIDKLQGEDGQ